jgi:cytoskeletal protein CcmA (bactofilin family)
VSNFFAKALIASYRVDEECHDSADGSDFAEQQPRKVARRAAKLVPVAPDDRPMQSPLPAAATELPAALTLRSVTFLSADVHFEGVIRSNCNVHVGGVVEGRIEASDHGILVCPGGRVIADLTVKRIVVEGEVVGNVVAAGRVENHSTGSIQGDVQTGCLIMEAGAQLTGALRMTTSTSETPDPLPPAGSR